MDKARYTKWVEDIDMLFAELTKRHENLFFQKDKIAFYNEIEDLKRDIQYYDDYEMQIKLSKVVASIGDAHTSLALVAKLVLPLEFYWFSEDIHIVSAFKEYEELKYSKLASINNLSISQVIERVREIISYENGWYLKSQLPKYLQAVDFLYGLEIIDNVDYVEIEFEDIHGNSKSIKVEPIPVKDVNSAIKSMYKHDDLPLYRRNTDKYFWFEYLDSFKTLYFKYNACRDMENSTVAEFGEDLISFIKTNDVEKLVLDMRNNFGGNSSLLDSFIHAIPGIHKINKKESLYVIIGRDTFSSALLNCISLKEKTNATFIGEPTGGKPNCYGEVERFKLNNFGIFVSCSTKYFKTIEDDSVLEFVPDVEIQISIEDYMENRDPCLEYINGINILTNF